MAEHVLGVDVIERLECDGCHRGVGDGHAPDCEMTGVLVDPVQASKVRYVRQAEVERLRSALKAIVGPCDSGPWIFAYGDAGGGYEGLQAIAREALDAR